MWLFQPWTKCGESSCRRLSRVPSSLTHATSTGPSRIFDTATTRLRMWRKSLMSTCTQSSYYSLDSSSCPTMTCCTSCHRQRTLFVCRIIWTNASRVSKCSHSLSRTWLLPLCWALWTKRSSSTKRSILLSSRFTKKRLKKHQPMLLLGAGIAQRLLRPQSVRSGRSRTGSLT